MKRIIAVICSVVVMTASMPVMAATEETTEFNGDIIKNPWAELFTDAPTEQETESQTEPETESDTTKNDSQEFDPASLTYTSLECAGTEGLSIDYCIQSSTIEGVTPWYGDGGATFQIAYADPNGEGGNGDVQVNGAAPAEGVVTMMGTGIFKINPTLLPDNAYSVIVLKLATAGEMTLVIKKGTPAETPTDPQPTEPDSSEVPTDAPTDAPTDVPTDAPTDAPTAAPTEKPTVVPTAVQTQKETTTAKKITVGKTKVKSASKKKTSNKIKISLKKIKNAKKYQVQISKTKKFKKVLVKKTVKKVKVTLKSKKFKNKKKLYVRARAVRVVGKKVYRGKWSKVKKIKIKK